MENNTARKEKSLSLLCQKFMSFYPINPNPNDPHILVSLDQMAKSLDVERRRIYDIVNVLESVEILSRYRKNQYIWHGFTQIPTTMSKLKTLSVKSKFVEYTQVLMLSQLDLHCDTKQAENVCFEPHQSSSYATPVETRDSATQTISISREEKSLGIMSQKFLMLFLTSEDGVVSINFAARVLLGDTKNDITEHGRYKTKIRRLYDIANVLSSIGLISKYQNQGLNVSKPAYKYIGPTVDIMRGAEYVYDFINSGNQLSNSKHSLFDHFKRNLNLQCNIPKFDVNTGILTSKDESWKRPVESKIETRVNKLPVTHTNTDVNIYHSNTIQTYDIEMIQEPCLLANDVMTDMNMNYQYYHHDLPASQKIMICQNSEVTTFQQRSDCYYTEQTDLVFKEQNFVYPSSGDNFCLSGMNQMNTYALPSINTMLN